MDRPDAQPKGIALFPGGFKPAHRDHLRAISYLCRHPEVDAVRVIVSDRARLLPGTHLALGGAACADALRYLLSQHHMDKPVSVHLATHRAIDCAVEMIDVAAPGSTLWFCIGEKDVANGDRRFHRLRSHPRSAQLNLRVMVLPSAKDPVHATQLRALLTSTGCENSVSEFLPPSLTPEIRAHYLSMLRAAVRPISQLVMSKVLRLLAYSPYADHQRLSVVSENAIDPSFTLITSAGKARSVLYAGDTVVSGSFDETDEPMPAQRLAVMVRVLRHLNRRSSPRSCQIAQVEYWDKRHRLLILAEPSTQEPEAAHDMSFLQAGSQLFAQATAKFLAEFHRLDSIVDPLWGTEKEEKSHWEACVKRSRFRSVHQILEPRRGLVHLNFIPANVRWSPSSFGVIGFERAGLYGDPAWDLASFIVGCRARHCDPALPHHFLSAYQRFIGRAQLMSKDPMRSQRALQLAALKS